MWLISIQNWKFLVLMLNVANLGVEASDQGDNLLNYDMDNRSSNSTDSTLYLHEQISMVYTGHKPNSPVTSHQIIGQKKNNELIIPNNVRPSINDIIFYNTDDNLDLILFFMVLGGEELNMWVGNFSIPGNYSSFVESDLYKLINQSESKNGVPFLYFNKSYQDIEQPNDFVIKACLEDRCQYIQRRMIALNFTDLKPQLIGPCPKEVQIDNNGNTSLMNFATWLPKNNSQGIIHSKLSLKLNERKDTTNYTMLQIAVKAENDAGNSTCEVNLFIVNAAEDMKKLNMELFLFTVAHLSYFLFF